MSKEIIKEVSINKMSCSHCAARVEKALNSLDGVKAKVDLASGKATLKCKKDISDNEISQAINDLGFECVLIQ